MDLSVGFIKRDGICSVTIAGHVDARGAARLEELLTFACADRTPVMIVSLQSCEAIDPIGLFVLKRCAQALRKMYVVPSARFKSHLMAFAGVGTPIRIVDSIADAFQRAGLIAVAATA